MTRPESQDRSWIRGVLGPWSQSMLLVGVTLVGSLMRPAAGAGPQREGSPDPASAHDRAGYRPEPDPDSGSRGDLRLQASSRSAFGRSR